MRIATPVHLLWLVPSLMAVAWAEKQWPMMALAFFVLITITLGFTHGAMDVFFLRDSKGALILKALLIYALAVVLIGLALAAWPGVALIALILLSLWHFGEQAHAEQAGEAVAWLLRLVQGGASVMLPALMSPNSLKPWVDAIAGADLTWVWPLWVGMAGLWCALLVAAFALVKPWHASAQKTLWLEVLGIALLNVLLSPLLAFAMFFGLYHSGMHIWRMRQLQKREGKAWHDGLLAVTVLITWLALAALLWWMSDQGHHARDAGLWLRWIVVALAAVTLPHLILVSQNKQRLFSQP